MPEGCSQVISLRLWLSPVVPHRPQLSPSPLRPPPSSPIIPGHPPSSLAIPCRPPLSPTFTIQNAGFDERASILLDEQSRNTIRVYADGSAHPERAGSAAVLLRDGCDDRVLRLSLPTERKFTACDTEVVALLLELIQAIGACTFPSSGLRVQRLLGEFYKQVDSLASISSHGSYSLQLCWVKGHVGVKGNVIANREARIAAMQGQSSPPDELPPNLNSII
ncbi:hypothetical protein BGW80DRAFT_2356 [Lactifluus volemus]|nr:hypothetical protein BGW80DRAFT_2356 [Lactifluus volemus]